MQMSIPQQKVFLIISANSPNSSAGWIYVSPEFIGAFSSDFVVFKDGTHIAFEGGSNNLDKALRELGYYMIDEADAGE